MLPSTPRSAPILQNLLAHCSRIYAHKSNTGLTHHEKVSVLHSEFPLPYNDFERDVIQVAFQRDPAKNGAEYSSSTHHLFIANSSEIPPPAHIMEPSLLK